VKASRYVPGSVVLSPRATRPGSTDSDDALPYR